MVNIRKSNADHINAGTYRKDRHAPKQTAKIKQPLPPAPEYLCDTGKREWYRVSELLRESSTLTAADSTILAVYCDMYALMVLEGPAKMKPAWITQLRLICNELGLTPLSRNKLILPEPEDKNTNEFDDL